MAELSQYSEHYFVPESGNSSWANMYHYIPEGARLLDVGCSTGNFGQALEQLKGCTAVGVDLNEEDIAEAKQRLTEAYVFDITGPGARELLGTFDVVVFADVIEHLPDPRAVLRAVHGLLNEGGIIVYSIPHMGHLSVRLDLLEGRFPYAELGLLDRTHLHFYDRVEVHDVFASTGFAVTDENPVVVGYPPQWTDLRLRAIGLESSPAFYDMLRVTEAEVFQYVGTASPAPRAALHPPQRDAFVFPPDEILEQSNRLIAENARLSAERAALVEENALLGSRFAELQAWANDLKKNPARAVVRSVKRRLTRR
ncbi:class I SAM-dependent methyltransferase [Conyzicola sp.]|uniref:class I SAM-dependent methyltransferase n=1 Tax=Conyzicola sp. TaxID=1969404 RepID=UPI0039892C23